MLDRQKMEGLANTNFRHLGWNQYPGRVLILGVDVQGKPTIVYAIMGRSENSRNRQFVLDKKGNVRTEAIDASKVTNPELIIYPAVMSAGSLTVVSNGRQTETILERNDLSNGLRDWIYEPDKPNYTPRISATFERSTRLGQMAILRRTEYGGTERAIFVYAADGSIPAGFGMMLTTYDGDGDPLPSYTGGPKLVPLFETANTADIYWDTLNAGNRVALVTRTIELDPQLPSTTRIINK